MPLNLKEKYDETKRALEILEVFFFYGLEDLFDKAKLSKKISLASLTGRRFKGKNTTAPEKLRLAFEELGPTFVKLGQVLSTRPDILSYPYIKELEKLQDNVPPVSYQEIKKQLHVSLGDKVENLFKKFEREPVASASIAQVHVAYLKTGEKVAVKIKRPGIENIIDTDTKIILEMAKFLKDKDLVSKIWRPIEISEALERSFKEELDFGAEIASQKKFIANFVNTPAVKIPKIFEAYSGDKVITMEFVSGVKFNRIVADHSNKYPKKKIAVIGADAILKQIFIDSFFHGDLHPGNMFWLVKTEQLAFIDFGIVGRLRDNETKALSLMLYGMISFDSEKVLLGLETLNIISSGRQSEELKGEIDILLGKYHQAALKDIKVAVLIQEIFNLMLKFEIRLPVNLVNLGKTLVTVEDLAKNLNPDFDIFTFVKPYVKTAIKRQTSFNVIKNKAENNLLRSGQLLENLPEDLQWILKNLKNNDFKINVEYQKLNSVLQEISRTGKRLSASLIIAGLVVGSSYIMPTFRWVGLAGYSIASIIGLVILFGMSKRNK